MPSFMRAIEMQGEVYCKACYAREFGPQGFGFSPAVKASSSPKDEEDRERGQQEEVAGERMQSKDSRRADEPAAGEWRERTAQEMSSKMSERAREKEARDRERVTRDRDQQEKEVFQTETDRPEEKEREASREQGRARRKKEEKKEDSASCALSQVPADSPAALALEDMAAPPAAAARLPPAETLQPVQLQSTSDNSQGVGEGERETAVGGMERQPSSAKQGSGVERSRMPVSQFSSRSSPGVRSSRMSRLGS